MPNRRSLAAAAAVLSLLAPVLCLAREKPEPKRSVQYGGRRLDFQVQGHSAFMILPSEEAAGSPWLWYAPTIGSHPNRRNAWLFNRLLDKGFAIGGVNVGESHGSPRGTRDLDAFYHHVVREYGLSHKPCLLAQSRGGLMLYNWATRAGNASRVQCIGGIYPVCDLRSYPGLARACKTYEMTERHLRQHLQQHNPLDRLAPLAAARVPILHLHGDADRVVPLEANSGELARRYSAMGGTMQLIVIKGQGHAEIPAYFESRALLDFLLLHGLGEERQPSGREKH